MTRLVPPPLPAPTQPKPAKTLPPLVTTNRFPLPLHPTYKLLALLQTEPGPLISTVLLLAAEAGDCPT